MRNMPKITRDQYIILIVIVILTCIMAALLALLVMLLLFKSEPPNRPTPVVDPTWAHIQAAGRIVVGTAADYPPFEYYNDRLQLDGFDIALMREVGDKLGVQVIFQDIIFDSLQNSLNLGQIDAAISAITITPEREAAYSFSNVYYVSQDGVLARSDSSITNIISVDQLAGWKVGVQTASVYQTWLQSNLVDSGKMPAGNLLAYPRVDQAVNDLKSGRIDLVVMDYLAAQGQAAQGGVKLVAKGISPQRYAIMIRQGNNELRTRVNQALLQLQNEGRIAELAQAYLDINPDQILPVPTAIPSSIPTTVPTLVPAPPTATPPGYCIDGMAFVADLNYPDFNLTTFTLVPPNTPFQKGWRIRNVGSCTWNSNYVLQYINGNNPAARMNGAPTPIFGVVPPGAEFDLYINLISPSMAGIYQGLWAMTNPRGETFGQRLWVAIQVPQSAPPTLPTPTTPAPGPIIYQFEVNPSSINAGGCTYLSWEVQGNVDQVRILRDGQSIWEAAPTKYAITECPPGVSLVTYEIQAIGSGGISRELRQLMIYPAVQPNAQSDSSIAPFTRVFP